MKLKNDQDIFLKIIKNFPQSLYSLFKKIPVEIITIIQEIRIRSDKPISLVTNSKVYFLTCLGMPTVSMDANLLISSQEEIFKIYNRMCEYSVYSYHNQIKNGFITIEGGHRVGICGTAVLDNSDITNIKNISSLNIRIARQISSTNLDFLKGIGLEKGGALFIGPPSSGKTTLLREIAKNLSIGALGTMKKVTVIDERGEIAAMVEGHAQNDLGFCDILNLFPKAEGIIHSIRSLSPDFIVCDELGKEKEILAVKEILNSGVNIIASIHAKNVAEFIKKDTAKFLIKTGAFKKIIVLKNDPLPGTIDTVYEEEEINDKINRNVNSDIIRNNGRICGIA